MAIFNFGFFRHSGGDKLPKGVDYNLRYKDNINGNYIHTYRIFLCVIGITLITTSLILYTSFILDIDQYELLLSNWS